MSVESTIEAIKSALDAHEHNLKAARRSCRKLHNLLAQGLADHGDALGLDDGQIVAFGGGTNKGED